MPSLRPAHELAVDTRPVERPLGRCVACFRHVTDGDVASFLDGELYHRECAGWRSAVYNGHAHDGALDGARTAGRSPGNQPLGDDAPPRRGPSKAR
jgi:hypothetical protein